MQPRLYPTLFVAALLFLLGGCSSTTINGVWKDPAYQSGQLDQVLVVSIAKKDLMQRLYEDKFVARFQAEGVRATPGYKVLQGSERDDLSEIQNLLGPSGYHYLLISRLVDKKTVEILHPGTTYVEHFPDRHYYYDRYPYYRHWRDYYRSSYSIIETTPPHTSLNEVVILETNVYDARDEIIFSVQTETLIDFGAEETIEDIVEAVTGAMKDHSLL